MNKRLPIICLLAALAITLTLAGCMLGPDYSRPDTAAETEGEYIQIPAGWADANDITSINGTSPWWIRFADPTTTDLVRAAMENNTDLKAAAASVLESQALMAQTHGARLPDLSYGAGRGRAKISFTSPLGDRASFFSTTYSQDLSISYITDLFGKLKRADRAAMADLLSVQAWRQALEHSVIASVIRTRVEVATQQRLLKIARDDIANRRQTLEIIERRYNSGLLSPLDVHLAKENLAAAEALAPAIEQAVLLSGHSLDVLIGQRPATSNIPADLLSDLPDLSPVPLGMPAALLDRRPDVRSAELKLAAATERVGVSIAALYPDFTLTGSAGFRSDSFREIADHQGEVYSAIIALAAPIWKGGQLRAAVKASKARVQLNAANYAGTILNALREVEDALVRDEMLRRRLALLETRLTEARSAEELARERYFRGVEKILIVLETERRRRSAENELVITKGRMWNARIDLFLALGGDWKIKENTETNEQKMLSLRSQKLNIQE